MTTEERYEWTLKVAVTNGSHPHDVLRKAVSQKLMTKQEEQDTRKMLVERSSEHTFDVKAH